MGRINLPDVIGGKHAKKGKESAVPGWEGWEGWGNQPTKTYKHCEHKGDVVIYTFSDGGKALYAASSHGLNERSGQWNLIIDLANVVRTGWIRAFIESPGEKWKGLKKFVKQAAPLPSEHLKLDWPDMNPPPVTLDFWLTLWELLPEKSVICCFGGHGRTGTCLASFMIADGVSYYDAVSHVRSTHCAKAIESMTQEIYLHDLYVEYLKRALAIATEAEKPAVEERLAYAVTHIPNAADSYGEKQPKHTPKAATTAPVVMGPALDHEISGIRHVGGRDYYQTCVSPVCKSLNCSLPLHQGWVEVGRSWAGL